MKKILCLGLVLIMLFALVGCSDKETKTVAKDCLDMILVEIKAEYKESFLNQEITVEDFENKRVKKLSYLTWRDKYVESEFGFMIVYLKTKREQKTLEVLHQIRELSFVAKAGTVPKRMFTSNVQVTVKEEYKDENGVGTLTAEDFKWDNIAGIKWKNVEGSYEAGPDWYSEEQKYYHGDIRVVFKEKSERQVIKAMEHFYSLDFVEYVKVVYDPIILEGEEITEEDPRK